MKSIQVNEVPENAQLIDVREPDEFSEVHAKNAVNLPLSDFAALSEEIDYEQPIYVICKSGGRSAEASQFLEAVRGTEAINVEGGTQAWVNAGLPTE